MATAVAMDAIVEALVTRRDELVAAAVEGYRARIPAYRDADPALLADAGRHTAEHHDLLCEVVRRGRPVEARELAFVERYAALRARRGISHAAFLEAAGATPLLLAPRGSRA